MSKPVRSRRRGSAPDQLDLFERGAAATVSSTAPAAPADPEPQAVAPDTHEDMPPSPPRPQRLDELLSLVLSSQTDARETGEMASAIRGVGKVLGRPLREIPADPAALAPLLAKANPMSAKMKPARWSRIQTFIRQALDKAGYPVMPGRDLAPRSPAWDQLLAGRSARIRHGLSRFSKWCSRRGVEPEQVTAEVFRAFLADLKGASLQAEPARTHRSTVKVWNEAKACEPAWPGARAEVLPDPRRYARGPDAFEAAFVADVEACLAQATSSDPFAKHFVKALRPVTVVTRRRMIYQVASALISSGFPVEQLTSLKVLVNPDNAERALRRLRARQGDKDIPQLAAQASTLSSIAWRWVHSSEEDVKTLRGFANGLRPKKAAGMTDKNRDRLRQFDLEANVAAFLLLPAGVVAREERAGEEADARLVELALAVDLLTVAPMRINNLAALDIERHLKIERRGREVVVDIFISPDEAKGGAPLHMPLPASSVRLLMLYLDRYRGHSSGDPGPWLFPGRDGHRHPSAFGRAISDFIKRETGLDVNPHLFRHIATKLHLLFHPDAIETMRRVLGHSSVEVTSKAYAEFDTARAFKRYGQTLARLKAQAERLSPRR
jgi:integrase